MNTRLPTDMVDPATIVVAYESDVVANVYTFGVVHEVYANGNSNEVDRHQIGIIGTGRIYRMRARNWADRRARSMSRHNQQHGHPTRRRFNVKL